MAAHRSQSNFLGDPLGSGSHRGPALGLEETTDQATAQILIEAHLAGTGRS